jgi:hypothetical protein
MRHSMKISLGTFACSGIEAHLGSDLAIGVREALADYTRRLDSDAPPIDIPHLAHKAVPAKPAKVLDLPVNEETLEALEREASRQGISVSQLAAHSVLVYLAEIDRMTPFSAV